MDHDYGDDNQQRMFASSSSSASGMAPPLPFPFLPFVASSAVMQATSDIDSLLQVHRRKMLRRAANRRSAQQSRARKKAMMVDIKSENVRLQRFAEILESSPDLTIVINREGKITYISERSTHCIKTSMPDESDDDPSHINQILTPESVETVLECVTQVIEAGAGSVHDNDGGGHVSAVTSVCYHDPNGFQARGYMRIARLVRRAAAEDTDTAGNNSDTSAAVAGPATKKSRVGSGAASSSVALTASNIAAAALGDASSASSSSSSSMDSRAHAVVGDSDGSSTHTHGAKKGSAANPRHGGASGHKNRGDEAPDEDEFVCTIRPADASFPVTGGAFSSLLSTASMVAHDLELWSSGRNNNPNNNEDRNNTAEERRGSPSGSHGSSHGSNNGSSFQPNSSKATSSETGSDDNRESEQDEQEPL